MDNVIVNTMTAMQLNIGACTVVIDRNVLLYWSDSVVPESVRAVREAWVAKSAGWSVQLFSREGANEFLRDHYSAKVSDMFSQCKLPAMQSDFFRVFWALHCGGIYSDISFTVKQSPEILCGSASLTCVRWPHGRIVNGLFYARHGSHPLQRVADEILRSVQKRRSNDVWSVTGPGAWIRVLEPIDPRTVRVLLRKQLFPAWVAVSRYADSTRGSSTHWSLMQKRESIFGTDK